MILLALDVTSQFGSIALRAGGRTVAMHSLESTEGFAHLIFPAIAQVLQEAGMRLEDVDCFASASGPGAFTGVRVGLAAVKGLAEATGKLAAGVSNLRALSTFGSGELRATVIDARRGEIFGAVYNGKLEIAVPEVVNKWPSWLNSLSVSPDEFICQPGFAMRSMLEGTAMADWRVVEAPCYLAEAVALCAELDGQAGRWSDPAALDANYVRRSDAELFWKED